MLLVLSLFACSNSKVPEDAVYYDVTVTTAELEDGTPGTSDECHPDATVGYEEAFTYAVAFDGSKATIYIGEDVFALGSVLGCKLEYSTVVIGEETEADGPVKWQLFGSADVATVSGDACVEGDQDWSGTEYFEIVNSEEETLEPGCQYTTHTYGTLVASPE